MSSTEHVPADEVRAFVVQRDEAGRVSSGIKTLRQGDFPRDAVLIRARWSSLNYKDALAATGHPGVVRRFPHVPGIDVAGEIAGFYCPPHPAPADFL